MRRARIALLAAALGAGAIAVSAAGADSPGVPGDSSALELPASTAKAVRRENGSLEVKSDFIRKLPGTMNDPIRAVSFAPGVTVQNDVNVRPFVRGGDASETRVIMNGIPLLQPYHVGGVFSMFNLNALESVELYRDDFPVENPGSLSGLLRMKTKGRIPAGAHARANLSMARGDLFAEAPLVKDHLSVNGAVQSFLFNRTLHGLLDLTSEASGDSAFKGELQGYRDHINMPDFVDGQAGASLALGGNLRADYSASLSGDGYAVVVPRQTNIFSRINPNFGDPIAPVYPAPAQAPARARRSKKLSIDSISSVGIGNRTHFLNVSWDIDEENLLENDFGLQSQDRDVDFKKTEGAAEPWTLSHSTDLFDYRLSHTWSPSETHRLKFGLAYDFQRQSYDVKMPYVLYDVIVNGNMDMLEPLGNFSRRGFTLEKEDSSRSNLEYLGEYPSRIQFDHHGALEEHFGALFFSHSIRTGSRSLTYGVRAEYQSTSGEFVPGPRMDYRWQVDGDDELRFTAGLYSQNNLPFYERDRNPSLKAEKSGQGGLRWTRRLGKGYRMSVDGYYKRYFDMVAPSLAPDHSIDLDGFLLAVPNAGLGAEDAARLKSILDTTADFASLPDSIQDLSYRYFGGLVYTYANTGTGNSLGTEWSFFYEPNAIWNGWLSADFSLSNRQDGEGQGYYPYRYHRPVVVNWVNYFDMPGAYEISFTFRWALGQPYTSYSGDGDGRGSFEPITVGGRNQGRLSPYTRLDLRLSRDARWWNRDFKAYVEVWNSMNNPNYFARDASTGQLKSAQLNWPFPLFFLGVSAEL